MNPNRLVGALELAARAGVSYKQIDSWTKLKYVRPEPNSEGTGHRRTYRPSEVRIAQIIGTLTRAGVVASVAAKAARTAMLEVDARGPVFMAELTRGVAVTGRIEL